MKGAPYCLRSCFHLILSNISSSCELYSEEVVVLFDEDEDDDDNDDDDDDDDSVEREADSEGEVLEGGGLYDEENDVSVLNSLGLCIMDP